MNQHRESSKDLSDQREFYNERWSAQQYVTKSAISRASAILDLLARTGRKSPRILDFGCGTGWLASILSTFGPTTALDLSDESIRRARERWPWIEFVAGDALRADFPPNSFDVVVSQEVIEHMTDQKRYLEQASRFLTAGGFLILTTPNNLAVQKMPPNVRRCWKDQPIEKRLTKRELLQLLVPCFETLRFGSTSLQYSRRGIYRLIHAEALRSILKGLALDDWWTSSWQKLGYGLHFHVLARKKG